MNREKVKQLTGKKVAERKVNKGQGRARMVSECESGLCEVSDDSEDDALDVMAYV